jgi:hypothetical protein
MAVVNGWVGDACSVGMSLGGTARSSMGKIGAPVSRLSTYSIPFLFAWSTAGTRAPSLVIVTSAGGDALS